jgi:NOL1/NOP2/fmu family ribosome biogenesis protein
MMMNWNFYMDDKGDIWLFTSKILPRIDFPGIRSIGLKAFTKKGEVYKLSHCLGRLISKYATKNKVEISLYIDKKVPATIKINNLTDGEYIVAWKKIPIGVSEVKKGYLIIDMPRQILEKLDRALNEIRGT